MNPENLNSIQKKLRESNPLIHCITNPISINQCANTCLAAGARPIMAEHPKEVSKITSSADALLLNLGNITDARIKSIKISAREASHRKIPFVLDLVGIACSPLRRKLAHKICKIASPDIIKGNYSEIYAFSNSDYVISGVDADNTVTEELICEIMPKLASMYSSVIVASGKTDIITDGKKLIKIYNGTPKLASVTGTGCMLGALCACFLSVSKSLEAAVCACALLGICGELSEADNGIGTYTVKLLDYLSTLTDEDFKKHLRTEVFQLENI